MRASRQEMLQLFILLDETQRLALLPVERLPDDLLNGLHSVFKDKDWDTPMLDGRRPNLD